MTQMTNARNGPETGLIQTRKPRVMITGEFSAGKTTLINGLLGQEVLPTRVTSTSMPPVWLIGGGDASFRLDLRGVRHDVTSLDEVNVEDTLVYVRSVDAPILEYCDLIDTPGSSDPNIPSECWERVTRFADTVIWCSGATQAWRQSEKATFRDMPDSLRAHATLLITQADRMPDDRSVGKVLSRVQRDATSLFASILMLSSIKKADQDLLRSHVRKVCAALTELPGIPLAEVDDLGSNPAQGPAVPETLRDERGAADIPVFFRPRQDAPVTRIGAGVPAPVTPIKTDVQTHPAATIGTAEDKDDVRVLWSSIVAERDLGDPATALDCLETLMGLLETRKHNTERQLRRSANGKQQMSGDGTEFSATTTYPGT